MTAPITVDLWFIDLNPPEQRLEELQTVVSAEELKRIQRLHFPDHQRRTLVTLAQRRLILAPYLNQPPESIQYATGPHGKPYIANSLWHFNLSHSHELALLAITQHAEVGVDIEYWRTKINIEGLVTKVLNEQELKKFHQLPANEHPASFYRAWTCKEAFIKALGLGLHYPLSAIEVEVNPTLPCQLIQATEDNIDLDYFALRSINVPAKYTAHLVIMNKNNKINIDEIQIVNQYISS